MPKSGRRRPNSRLIKIHRSYAVDEIARALSVHKNTVRNWLRRGLPKIDQGRPTLIHGRDLRDFLEAQRKHAKRPSPPNHIFCVKCRMPKVPAGNMAEYVPITSTSGNLRAICPECETLIHRRVSRAQLDSVCGDLEVQEMQASPRIRDRSTPSVNCDSN